VILSDWPSWLPEVAGGLVCVAIIGFGLRMLRGLLPELLRRHRGPACAVCGKVGWEVVPVPLQRPGYQLYVWVCSVDHLAQWQAGVR
jgi:hypothetical protein